MATTFTASTAFVAKDRYSPVLLGMRHVTKAFGISADRSFVRANRRLTELNKKAKVASHNLKKAFGPIGKFVPLAGAATLTAGLTAATMQTIALDDAVSAAAGKFGVFSRQEEGFNRLEIAARKAGASTEFTAGQSGEALSNAGTASFTLQQSISGLPKFLDLATASQADLATTTEVSAKTMSAFGLISKDATKNTAGLQRVTDVLMKTINTSGFKNLPEILTSIGGGAATVKAAGGDLETFAAATGILAKNGIEAGKTGTDVRNIFLAFTKQSAAGAKVLKRAGVTAFDKTTGKMKDMFQILGELKSGTKAWSEEQRSAGLATLFGARTVSSINILMDKGVEKLNTYRNTLRNSKGETAKVAALQRQTLGNAFKIVASSAAEAGISLIKVFEPALKGILSLTVKTTTVIGNFIKENETIVQVLAITAAAFVAVKGSMVAYYTGMLIYTKVMKSAIVAQWLLNTAIFANPIAWVIVGVIALTAGIVLLLKKYGMWEPLINKVTAAFSFGVTVLKAFAMVLWSGLKPAIEFITPLFKAYFSLLIKFWTFVAGPFIAGFKMWLFVMKSIWSFIGGPLTKVFDVFIGSIKDVGKTIINHMLWPVEKVLSLAAKLPGVGGEFADALAKINSFREDTMNRKSGEASSGGITGQGFTGPGPLPTGFSPQSPSGEPAATQPVNLRKAEIERKELIEKQSAEITIKDETKRSEVRQKGSGIPIRTTTTNAAFAS